MGQRKRRSRLWAIPREQLLEILEQSSSVSEVLRQVGLRAEGGNHRTLHERLKEEGIDLQQFQQHWSARLRVIKASARAMSREQVRENLFIADSPRNRKTLRRHVRAMQLIPYACGVCGLGPEWNDKPLTLVLDHKNGAFNDNRVENLQWVCPNCDSQQLTFRARNNKTIGVRSAVGRVALDHQSEVQILDTEPRKDGRRKPMPEHGTRSRYQRGCHCDDCRSAYRQYQNTYYRLRRKPSPEEVPP